MRRVVRLLLLALALRAGALGAATATLAPSADATIFEENGDAADSKGPGLFAGRNTQTFVRRALLSFDVASAVPAGSTVSGVQLRLVLTRAKGNPVDVSLVRVLAAWHEGTSNAGLPGGTGTGATPGDVTWTRRIWPSTPWVTAGGDVAASASATTPVSSTLGTFTWGPTAAMTADVQGWLAAPAANFGWALRADELQAAPSARRFGSRESANAAEVPQLVITYAPAGPGPAPADDVPALSDGSLLALGAALAVLGAIALRRT